jgi:serine phosphatase RsbU (regulator of sigma subunit)
MTQVGAQVLLVEDDEGDALLVRECLREVGYDEPDVAWRRSVSEGIEALTLDPDCVLLDLGLPDAQGLEALTRFVAQQATTPVIVLTGRHDRTGVEAVAAGAQDYLVKDDITPELLDRTIKYAVQRRMAQLTEFQLREERMLAAENSRLERGLLPKPLLLSDFVACRSHYRPGRAGAVLGGDFFDVVETTDGSVRAIIGDVMGHGPDEAALGVHLRVAWRAMVLAGVPSEQILTALSRLLYAESGGGVFTTACDLTIDRDRSVTTRVAGHPPPLLCAGTTASFLDVEVGPPLGIEDLHPGDARADGDWPVSRSVIPDAGAVVLYTDGLLDAYRRPESRTSVGLEELAEVAADALATGDAIETLLPVALPRDSAKEADDTALVVLSLAGSAA